RAESGDSIPTVDMSAPIMNIWPRFGVDDIVVMRGIVVDICWGMAIEGSELGPTVIMEEEEGSNNVGYGYSATSWLQVEMVIVKY
ncbi:hypothetical protein GW17_00055842, partial [Ensete ventricosum]